MQREQTAAEKARLEEFLSKLPTGKRRVKEAVENFLVMLAAFTLTGVLVWAGIAWMVATLFDFDLGWFSNYAFPIAPVVVAASAVFAALSTMRWMKSWADHRQPIRDDLESGSVTEEKITVLEAKLLQEPEHGSLIYFLNADDGRILVLYDRESLDLAMADEDPMGSSFEPQSLVTIVKAPQSGFTISVDFNGENIDILGPTQITVAPNQWPDDEQFCAIPWEQIEQRLCS